MHKASTCIQKNYVKHLNYRQGIFLIHQEARTIQLEFGIVFVCLLFSNSLRELIFSSKRRELPEHLESIALKKHFELFNFSDDTDFPK